MAILSASLTAKLTRLPAREFRAAINRIDGLLKKDRPTEPQDPDAQRLLILDWAESLGLKVQRHDKPVI